MMKTSKLKPKRVVHCHYCRQDLEDVIHFECAQCVPRFVLCIECFSQGRELHPHENHHPYRVSFNLGISLFENGWKAHEELLLMDGLKQFGLGNWESVGERVGRLPQDCASHYYSSYCDSPDFPFPVLFDANKTSEDSKAMNNLENCLQSEQVDSVHVTGQKRKVQSVEGVPLSNSKKKQRKRGSTKQKKIQVEVAGFMQKRGDFEIEYDNDAEDLLADMTFSHSDSNADKQMKLQMLRIYNEKMRIRNQMKEFVISRGCMFSGSILNLFKFIYFSYVILYLTKHFTKKKIFFQNAYLNLRKKQSIERRRSKDERRLYAQHAMFERFYSQEEHERHMNGLYTELCLRRRILLLQNYRREGIRDLKEAKLYEDAKKHQQNEQLQRKRRQGANYLSHSKSHQNSGSRAERRQSRSRNNNSRGNLSRNNSHSNSSTSQAHSSNADSTNNSSGNVSREAVQSRSRSPTIDIENAQGYNELINVEKTLCKTLKLLPHQFCEIKSHIYSEYKKRSTTQQVEKLPYSVASDYIGEYIVKVDIQKKDNLLDFFVHSGWLESPQTGIRLK